MSTKKEQVKEILKNQKTDVTKLVRNVGVATAVGSAVFSAATVGAANYLVEQITKPTPVNFLDNYTFSPFELQVDYERVSFPTADGSTLSGWLFPRPGERRVVLTMSGYRGRKEDMLGISSYLWRNGYNVMLFDYRGHGVQRTKKDLLTLGHRELEDFQAALSYIQQRFEQPLIGALGGSMGAAVAVVAAARHKEILAVWSDSAFASQRDVIAHGWQTVTHLPTWPVVDVAEGIFKARTGHGWNEFAPVKEIAQIAPRPVYIVHGANDSVAPVSDAYALYEAAAGPKELWIEDDLEHCGVYFYNREEYSRRVLDFFNQYLVPATVEEPRQTQTV
jgi:fermentation-respiration switch protein FrsA (DUF1100 family)